MRERISGYQLFMLCTMLYINGGMISLFKSLVEVSGQDAWFDFVFSMLYAVLIAYLLYRLFEAYPGKNMFEICEIACGKWIGRLLNVIVLVYIVHLFIRDLRLFGDFVGTAVLQRTPIEIIFMSAMLVVIYYATGSFEELTRAVNLIFPIFLVSQFLLPLLLANEIEFRHMEPILAKGAGIAVKGGVLGAGWTGDVFLFGAFLNYFRSAKQFYVSLRLGIVLSSFVLTMLMFLNIAVLGPTTAARAMYPNYTLTEQINITDFLDRLDVLLIGFWLPAFMMKMIIIYFAFLAGLSSMLNTGKMRAINVMSGWFLLVLTLVSFNSVMEVYRFGNYGAIPVTVCMHAVFFLLVGLGGYWRRRRQGGRSKQSGGQSIVSGGMLASLSVALAVIFAGGWAGAVYKLYGLVGAALYAAAFIGMLIFSIREFIRFNRIVPQSDGS